MRPRFLQWLYSHLYEPIAADLKNMGATLICLVPDQFLHLMPLHAMVSQEGRYLIEDYAVAYAPSAALLPYLFLKRKAKTNQFFICGNPTGDLAAAEAEAFAIAAMLDTPCFVRGDATVQLVKTEAENQEVLHFACHGTFNLHDARLSHLRLADDQPLHLDEIFALELKRANLVVLSACRSAQSEITGGDELVGMTRAWLYAGTPSVIASLWNVNDVSTKELMVAFYRKWRHEGKSKARALQEAQVEWLNQKRHELRSRTGRTPPWNRAWHESLWAAFILVGDWL